MKICTVCELDVELDTLSLMSMEPWAAVRKLYASVAVPPVAIRVPSQ